MTDDTRTSPAPDWAYDWGKVQYNPMQERAAFNVATGGPRGMIPRNEPISRAEPVEPVPPNAGGGRAERELGPQPGIDLIDRMCVNADQRERQQAQAPDMMTQMMTMMMQQQTQMLALLAHLTNKEAAKTDRPKAKGKKP